jgi:hypothetical protein
MRSESDELLWISVLYSPCQANSVGRSQVGRATHPGDEVQFNDNLALPFEAGKTYRLRVVK